MTPGDNSGGNERQSAAHHVDGYHIEALPLIGRKLAKIRAQKVRKRPRGVDALVPARERRAFRAFHNRRAHDGDGKIAAPARKNRLAQTLCKRVGVRPAQVLRTAHAHACEPVPGQRARLRFRIPSSSLADAEASSPPRPSAWRRSALVNSGLSARASIRRIVSRSESTSRSASNCGESAGL